MKSNKQNKNITKIIIGVIVLISVILYICIVFNINKNSYQPEICTYQIGEEIMLNGDFFFNESDKANGYCIKALNTNIITKEEFINKYTVDNKDLFEFSEHIYLVEVNFKNISAVDDGSTGIDLSNYMLQSEAFMEYINCEAFGYINEIDYPKFYLDKGTDCNFILPFGIDSEYISLNELSGDNTSLVISLFPCKNIIYLNRNN